MTRDEAKKLLPIIEVYANGEEVQMYIFPGKWEDCDDPVFSPTFKYRIKPKPREIWIVEL